MNIVTRTLLKRLAPSSCKRAPLLLIHRRPIARLGIFKAPVRYFSTNKYDRKESEFHQDKKSNESETQKDSKTKSEEESNDTGDDSPEPLYRWTKSLSIFTLTSLLILVASVYKVKLDFDKISHTIKNDPKVDTFTNKIQMSERTRFKIVKADGQEISYEYLASLLKPVFIEIQGKSSKIEIKFRKFLAMTSGSSLVIWGALSLLYSQTLKKGFNSGILMMLVITSFLSSLAFFSLFLKYFEIYGVEISEIEDILKDPFMQQKLGQKPTLINWLKSNILIMNKEEFKKFEAEKSVEQRKREHRHQEFVRSLKHQSSSQKESSDKNTNSLETADSEGKKISESFSSYNVTDTNLANSIHLNSNPDSYEDSFSSASSNKLKDLSRGSHESKTDKGSSRDSQAYVSAHPSLSFPDTEHNSSLNENRLQDLDSESNRAELEKLDKEIKDLSRSRN